MRRELCAVVAAALLMTPTSQAAAWGDEGHEVVALIAQNYLTPDVKARIDVLLASDPDPLTAPDFVSRATWADKYREATGFHGPNWQATHNWHFVNLEVSGPDLGGQCPSEGQPVSGPASQGPAEDCVVDKIEQFSAELADPNTPQVERLLALKFVLHFVGDVHQPLHDADDQDAGGNCVHIHLPKGHANNLHAFWDTNVVTAIDPDPQRAAAALLAEITPSAVQAWSQDTSPADWAQESFGVATASAYTPALLAGCVGGKSTGSVALDADYIAAADAAARIQLEKAGVRLATLLNAVVVAVPESTGDR